MFHNMYLQRNILHSYHTYSYKVDYPAATNTLHNSPATSMVQTCGEATPLHLYQSSYMISEILWNDQYVGVKYSSDQRCSLACTVFTSRIGKSTSVHIIQNNKVDFLNWNTLVLMPFCTYFNIMISSTLSQ